MKKIEAVIKRFKHDNVKKREIKYLQEYYTFYIIERTM